MRAGVSTALINPCHLLTFTRVCGPIGLDITRFQFSFCAFPCRYARHKHRYLCKSFFVLFYQPQTNLFSGNNRCYSRRHRYRRIWLHQLGARTRDRRHAPHPPLAPWRLAGFFLCHGLCPHPRPYIHQSSRRSSRCASRFCRYAFHCP